LSCNAVVGPRMSEKDGFQALSIARKTPVRRDDYPACQASFKMSPVLAH
jgi:hypothetical protein